MVGKFFRGMAVAAAMAVSAPALAVPITVPQDVILLADTSGSLGFSGFTYVQEYLDYLNSQMPGRDDTRLGLINFSTDVITEATIQDNLSVPSMLNEINTMSYQGGFTNTVGAIQSAIQQFDAYSDDLNPKLMVLITDGNPYMPYGGDADVCQFVNALNSRGITTIVAGVGSGLSQNRVDCLLETMDDFFYVDSDAFFGNPLFAAHFGLSYTYDPDPPPAEGAPAPGALAIIGLGLLSVGALRRRSLAANNVSAVA
ncbi:MAG: VWA domain-containing protein [Rhodobacteraceae bacterium]|nr:VWA domain-containing protein [Paracoccaceae bacterium]